MENMVEIRSTFTGCNIKSGKVVMQFELDGEYRGALPALALMTGTACTLTLSSDQQVLCVDRGTGEIVGEDQTSIDDELADDDEIVAEVLQLPAGEGEAHETEDGDDTEGGLPPAAREYEPDDDLDDIFGAENAA